MPQLAMLFRQYPLDAHVFFTGPLCSSVPFDGVNPSGHLHLLRKGTLRITHPDGSALAFAEPTAIFYARPMAHTLQPGPETELICAEFRFGDLTRNPITRSMPQTLALPLAALPALSPAVALLAEEAQQHRPGRQTALDRLGEYLLILLLRHLIETQALNAGAVAGLADARLQKVLTAVHEAPARPWTVATMAHTAGMSRSRFAHHFCATIGMTPMDYVADWRIALTQNLLLRGRALKAIAAEIGYASPATLARVFVRRTGQSPGRWLAAANAGRDNL